MRSSLVLVALVCISSIAATGCGAEAPPAAAPTAPAPPPPEPAPTASAAPAPAAPQPQLVTITTKSPDAKAALLAAWDLSDYGRNEEALDQCRKAVAADPDFAMGHTCIGNQTSGAAGQAELDQGAHLAASLPDAERLSIEAAAAQRRQDVGTYYADVKRVADLAPDDYHAQVWLAWGLVDQRDFAGASAAFRKALDLNPGAAFVHGALTWVHTQLREYDDALASARKYADAMPGQANAHQSLALALVNLGRAKEAEPELAKAVDLAPKSRSVYYDYATVKVLDGDFAGARDVLDKSQATEARPTDGLERAAMAAWTLLDEGKTADAFKLLDATEKDSDARKLPWPAHMASVRAWAQWLLGKPADALKTVDASLARCERPESSEAYKEDCRRNLLTIKAFAQIQASKITDAQQTVALLRDEAKKWQGNNWVQLASTCCPTRSPRR